APVEPARQPEKGEAGHLGSTLGLDLAFLIQGQLLTQKEILRRECRRAAQTEAQKLQAITQECPKRAEDMKENAEPARTLCHSQHVPLQPGADSFICIICYCRSWMRYRPEE